MSSYKASIQGADHKRVPNDIDINPTIIGHEFAGIILKVGKKWQQRFRAGQKFSIQPAMAHMRDLLMLPAIPSVLSGAMQHI